LSEPTNLWKSRAEALEKARRRLRAGHPEGLHDLRVALRRTSSTAAALGQRRLAQQSKDLVRSLSATRQLEVDRELLSRVAGLGLLSPQSAARLEARWEGLARKLGRRAGRVASSPDFERLARAVARRRLAGTDRDLARLERARRKVEAALALPAPDSGDRALHRYRLRVKRARYLAEDLAASGAPGFSRAVDREKALQEALGRWNDVRMFRERLAQMRREAESQGAVSLASELARVAGALEATEAAARQSAVRLVGGPAQRFPRRASHTA